MRAQESCPKEPTEQAFAFPSCLLVFSQDMKPKLLRDSETDVSAHRHEYRCCRMCNIPIDADPNVHARTESRVRRESSKQHVSATSVLRHSPDPVVLRMQPGERWPDEPLPGHVLRFVGPIGKPEP